jgi:ribosomal protein S18 acetylase RimI-like enzyme
MDLNLKIKNISIRELNKITSDYMNCDYWFDYGEINFLNELSGIRSVSELKGLIRVEMFKKKSRKNKSKIITFKMQGGRVKGAFAGGRCVGVILAGDCSLFPRLRSFNVFPPDFKSTFIGCIQVIPEYRDANVDKRLLVEIEKELVKENVEAIESIGRRLDDDIDELEYYNGPFIPFKFLINNGFYLKKNDPSFPLLRLDLKNITFGYAADKVLVGKVALEKEPGA